MTTRSNGKWKTLFSVVFGLIGIMIIVLMTVSLRLQAVMQNDIDKLEEKKANKEWSEIQFGYLSGEMIDFRNMLEKQGKMLEDHRNHTEGR